MPPTPEAAAAGPQPYEWSVLRAVPRVERCEFVNVGVVLYCQALDFLAAAVTPDLSRAQALAPDLDADAVGRHLSWVRALCAGEPSVGVSAHRSLGERFRWLTSPRSTVVQCSPVHTGLTAAPEAALAELFRRMVL